MKKRQILMSCLLVIIIIFTAACGSASRSESYVGDKNITESSMAFASMEQIAEDDYSDEAGYKDIDVSEYKTDGLTTGGAENQTSAIVETRKLIVTTSLDMETMDFDKGIEEINALVKAHDGYIESSSISGQSLYQQDTRGARIAYFTLRVPTKTKGTFVDEIRVKFNVINTQDHTSDITESYYDTETWLKTLEEQYARLEALLEKSADQLEYIIQIENEMSRLRMEINSVYNNLKRMDSQVDYSTVNLSVTEVVEYEKVESLPLSFGERVSRAFEGSWKSFVSASKNFVIFLIYSIPGIIILAIIFIIVFVIIKKRQTFKKSKKEKEAKKDSSEETEISQGETKE